MLSLKNTVNHRMYGRRSDIFLFVKEAVAYLLEREAPMAVRIEGAADTAPTPRPSGGRRVLFGTVPAFDYQGEGVKVDDVTAISTSVSTSQAPKFNNDIIT